MFLNTGMSSDMKLTSQRKQNVKCFQEYFDVAGKRVEYGKNDSVSTNAMAKWLTFCPFFGDRLGQQD